MPYQVFDNNKPADTSEFSQIHDDLWSQSKFDTLEQAQEYVTRWFWPYITEWTSGPGKVDYSGYGDIAEIRLVD